MTIADLLSVDTELVIDGQTYKVHPPTLLEQGKFQRWLEQRARESVDRATYLDEAARDRGQNRVTTDVAAGLYEWGGEVALTALRSKDGVAKLIEIILGVPEPTARAFVDDHLKKIVAVLKVAADDDPKAVAQALKELGLPANFLGTKPTSSSASGTRRSTKRGTKSRR